MIKLRTALILLIVVCLLFSMCACGSSSRFVGNWICDEVHSGYPDQMTLNRDGTGMADGFTCSWNAKDGRLKFNVGSILVGNIEYDYEFRGSRLYLDDYGYTKR